MDFLSKSPGETQKLAQEIADKLKSGDILLLEGDLGAGKTTFTRYLVEALGIEHRVQSPTFVIARRYSGGKGKIKNVNHLDLYRLTDKEDLENLGINEISKEPDTITIIEWPELAYHMLSEKPIKIKFESLGEDERKINVEHLY